MEDFVARVADVKGISIVIDNYLVLLKDELTRSLQLLRRKLPVAIHV
jgi:hypothetical protein